MSLKKNVINVAAATLAVAAGVGIMTTLRTGETSKVGGIESATIYAVPGRQPMFLYQEPNCLTNDPLRLRKHIVGASSFIVKKFNLVEEPVGSTLTFFCNNATNTSGWNVAYPTAAAKTAATNEIAELAIAVRELSAVDADMNPTLGWLGYVDNSFLSNHSSPIDFSEMNPTNGCWLYR